MAVRGKSARQFGLDLDRFKGESREKMRLIFRKIALDLDQAVVMSTPVDQGVARGNWYPSINTPSGDVDLDKKDKAGGTALNAITTTASRAELGTTIWLTNNLPYILVLENGSSKQAPQGMVDQNLARFASALGGGAL